MNERFARVWCGCFFIMIMFSVLFGMGWAIAALVWLGVGLVKGM